MPKHTPRRSGVGARQVLPPRPPKQKRLRFRGGGPELCGAQHPDSGLTCTAVTHYQEAATGAVLSGLMGLPTEPVKVDHRGKHRARILDGIVVRWEDGQ